MRITRDTLLRLAKETVQQRSYSDKTIIAAYLFGSLLTEEPFLGGTTDIDLVFVHAERPALSREVVKLSGDVHLDIVHRIKKDYEPARELRVNPILGYELYDPLLLHETQHFFEFHQAALRSGFHEPAQVLQRCYTLMARARQTWMDLQLSEGSDPTVVLRYLGAVENAANAVCEFTSAPLTDRRFLLDFPARAEAAGKPGFAAGLLGLIGGNKADADLLGNWLPAWEADFLAAAGDARADASIKECRLPYYRRSAEAMLGSDSPVAALWPLLRTWTLAANILPSGKVGAWESACRTIGLSGEGFEERVQGLDQFLDEIEIMLEDLAAANGLEMPGGSL